MPIIQTFPSKGGSDVIPNPAGAATDNLETIEIDSAVYAVTDSEALHNSDKGVASGVAALDVNGKVPSAQLPSYVDDVVEGYYDSTTDRFYEESTFTTIIPPIDGKSWVDISSNKSYRWTGSVYVRVDEGVQLGETSNTAYRGDRGKTAYDHSQSDHSTITPSFTEASTRANILSGESFATLFGKIKKFFTDLKAVAFSGSYNDLSDQPTIPAAANNNTITIQLNGTTIESFTLNQATDETINIQVTKSNVGLGNVPNVATNDQTPTFTQASTRANIASGEKLSVILGKIMKFFADLKTVAFSGSYSDLSNQPTIPAAVAVKGNAESSYRTGNVNLTPANIGALPSNGTAVAATKATQDGDGNAINTTYMKKGVDYVRAGQKSGATLGICATAEGLDTTASGTNSHAEGLDTMASGENSHAEGCNTTASGYYSHAEGYRTIARNYYAHAEGYNTKASTSASHAEGDSTEASGLNAHSEGYNTKASGKYSHAEGGNTTASAEYAHSEGVNTTASGKYSHAEGGNTGAFGYYSHAEGMQTIAKSDYSHVEGKYNVEDTNGTYAHIIGGGSGTSDRKNIFTVDWNGDVCAGRSNGLTNDLKLPTGADVVSYLNSKLDWTLLATKTGTSGYSFNTQNYSELWIIIETPAPQYWRFTFHILPVVLTSTTMYFTNGDYYASGGNYTSARISLNKDGVTLNACAIGSTSYANTAIMKVYGR